MADSKTYAQIVGWGYYVPSKVLTNQDLSKMVDTTDEWITTRTGISERHIAAPRESTSTMGTRAAQAALQVADIPPGQIDLVILATFTPDHGVAATASQIQDGIGANRAGAFDLNAGCSGFVYALAVASRLVESGAHKNVLVVGADTVSRVLDWSDRATCVLFGDGAGAVVLSATAQPTGMLSCVLGSDGSGTESLLVPAGGSRLPASTETVQNRQHYLKMNGNEVYRFAVAAMSRAAEEAIQLAGLTTDEIDLLIPHQANIRIIRAATKALKLPASKVFVNLDRYANTSAASIPIAICEAVQSAKIKPGDKIALVGFGAGLSWAAAVIQWGLAPTVKARWWRRLLHVIWWPEAMLLSRLKRTRRRIEAFNPNEIRRGRSN